MASVNTVVFLFVFTVLLDGFATTQPINAETSKAVMSEEGDVKIVRTK